MLIGAIYNAHSNDETMEAKALRITEKAQKTGQETERAPAASPIKVIEMQDMAQDIRIKPESLRKSMIPPYDMEFVHKS